MVSSLNYDCNLVHSGGVSNRFQSNLLGNVHSKQTRINDGSENSYKIRLQTRPMKSITPWAYRV